LTLPIAEKSTDSYFLMKRPALYIAIAYSLGILSSSYFKFSILFALVFTAAFIITALVFSKKNFVSHASLYLGIFFFGIVHLENSCLLPANHVSNFLEDQPKRILLKGSVANDPEIGKTHYKKEKTSFTLTVNSISRRAGFRLRQGFGGQVNLPYGWQDATGMAKVDVYSDRRMPISYGDEIILKGVLQEPHGLRNPGLFDYSKYLKMKNIYAVLKVKGAHSVKIIGRGHLNPLKKVGFRIRHWIRDSLDEHFRQPFNGFLKDILIGDRTGLNKTLEGEFIKTGTVHILSISGLHIALIAGIFLFLFRIFTIPKKPAFILAIICLIFYSYAAGASPPIIRSTIMFSLIAFGFILMRDNDILNSLSIAAILILLVNPKELFDPGFQLSFLSVGAIVIISPKIQKLFAPGVVKGAALAKRTIADRIKVYLTTALSVSIAAWLGTWPFVSLYFNIASPIALIANLIIIPISSLILGLSIFFLSIAPISNLFAHLAANVICMSGRSLFIINHILSETPFSYFRTPSPSGAFIILYYAFLFLLCSPKRIVFGNMHIGKTRLFSVLLFFLNILCWNSVLDINLNKNHLKATFFDVGQGDSALIEFPGKQTLLIDAGTGSTNGEEFDIGKEVLAPYLWNNGISTIDAAVVTHFHKDHSGGMPYVLKNFKVGTVITNSSSPRDNASYDEFKNIVTTKRIRHLIAGEGDSIKGFDSADIYVLNPPFGKSIADTNENSLVMKIVYRGATIIFCGDVSGDAIARLCRYSSFLKSDVLKVPHHGGNLGNMAMVKNFFKKISPKISVISVGRLNHAVPSKETLDIITSLNSISYETKNYGAIEIVMAQDSLAVSPTIKQN